MAYDVKAAEALIRQRATAKGMDPNTAVKVARSEGLANGIYQSNLGRGGRREPSYGPFQLLVGGPGTGYGRGLGNAFIEKTGLDPRDPSTVPQQIDFALDQAKAGGWSPWFGAKKVGVGRWDGIKAGTPTNEPANIDVAVTGGGSTAAYGGAGDDTLGTSSASFGGLGGLGGMPAEEPKVFGWRDALGAVADSLMTAPADEWWADTGKHIANAEIRDERRADRREARDERRADRMAIQGLLRSQGFTAEEAQAGSANASVANTMISQRREQTETNQTKNWLRTTYPDLADQVDAGLPITEGLRIAQERRKTEAGTSSDLGLNPQYGVDAQGNPVLLQLGKDGKVVQSAMPDGVTLSKEPIRLDAGTHFVLLDPITRQPIGQVAKDNRGEASETAAGTVEGRTAAERAASSAGDIQSGENALKLIADIRSDPYKSRGTGASSVLNAIPGTGGYDFANKVEAAKAGAFLQAIQQMRGLGALSNTEGQAATAAITRMNTSTSEGEFDKALNDYEAIVRQAIAKAQRNGGASGAPAPAAPAPSLPPEAANPFRSKYGLE